MTLGPLSLPRRSVLAALIARNYRLDVRSLVLLVVVGLSAIMLSALRKFSVLPQAISSAAELLFYISPLTAAGAISRDYASGSMVLDRLHGARPSEILVASLCSSFTVPLLLLAIMTAAAVLITGYVPDSATWSLIGACVLGVGAWIAFLVALGSVLPSTGNAVLGFGFMVMFVMVGTADPESLAARVIHPLRAAIPGRHQLNAFAVSLVSGEVRLEPLFVLGAGLIGSVALAFAALKLRDPASGWRR